MPTKIYLSTAGRVVDPEEATVNVYDRGFLYGDSIYETLRTISGRPVELTRHLQRLSISAEGIAFELPFRFEEIGEAIRATHEATGNADSKIRVVVTRGAGPMLLDTRRAAAPLLVIYAEPLTLPSAAEIHAGIRVVIVDPQVSLRDPPPGLKTGNYLRNIVALGRAIAAAGDDAIMLGADGAVTEAATSNVFLVRNGVLITPAIESGLLAGITRAAVIELATQMGIGVEERVVKVDELRRADELFLTSSVRGIMPVASVDGVAIGRSAATPARDASSGSGAGGPVADALRAAYDRYLSEWASGERS